MGGVPTLSQADRTNSGCRAVPALVGIGTGLAMFALLPQGVVVVNDDFGYLRSVLETAERGRPWTDDWLAPWSASLSILSALVFKLSGSFRLATQGLQCVLWGVLGFALTRLLQRRQFPAWGAAPITLSLCLIPTVLWKGAEFSALALYLPCLVLAIDAAANRRWKPFAVCAGLALASRQSALAWFAIPVVGLGQSLWSPRGTRLRQGAGPMLACTAGAAVWIVCRLGMNQTHAQRFVSAEMWPSFQIASAAMRFGFGLAVALVCMGAANALAWLFRKSPAGWSGGSPARFVWRGLLPAAVIAVFFLVNPDAGVQREHDLYHGAAGYFHLATWCALAGFGWLVAPVRVDVRLICGALAAAVLASVRMASWDYYWIDTAFLAFFSVLVPPAEREPSHPAPPAVAQTGWRLRLAAALGVIVLLLAPAMAWVDRTKQILDDCRAREVILEQSLRAGEISPTDLSVAPFGFIGWHLYPYFITTPEGATGYIGSFRDYLRPGGLAWETRGADNPDPLPDPESVVRTGVFPIGWSRAKHQFILRRRPESSASLLEIDFNHYRREKFPLDDAEWRQWRRP